MRGRPRSLLEKGGEFLGEEERSVRTQGHRSNVAVLFSAGRKGVIGVCRCMDRKRATHQ